LLTRRSFLAGAGAAIGAAPLVSQSAEPIIDIHQHTNYTGRGDDELIRHQREMGVTKTILLPAGSKYGLAAGCGGNDTVVAIARRLPREYVFFANELPDIPEARPVIERYLKMGAIGIGEQKFGVECDSPAMQKIYELAAEYRVPVLMHWQYKMYNYGFERFYKMLEKYPKTTFIGHAQTWWAHIDKSYVDDEKNLYPKTKKIVPGGITDRYLSDYPNMYGDLSAGSGLNALTRDEEHTREFFKRHQDKLIYGSDCEDLTGRSPECQGANTIAAVKRLAPSKKIERKLLAENARRVFRI